jgi:hypothetical protein
MNGNRVQTGEKDRIQVYALDSSNVGVTGATITLSIGRQSDGFYWSGTGYTSTFTGLTMTETDSVNLPGVYHYDFTPRGPSASFTLNATTVTAGVANAPWHGELKQGDWVDYIDAATTSRASTTDASNILKHIGTSIVELDLQRLFGFCGQILSAIKEGRKR